MSRAPLRLLLSIALAASLAGCGKEHEGTTHPAQGEVDRLKELEAIPGRIQAEVDLVLQPIHDVDVVIDQVASMPQTLGVDAASLQGLARASLEPGEVAVSLDVPADARAEVEAVLEKLEGIVTGLEQTPARAKTATADIAALGTRAAGLVSTLTAAYQAELLDPRLETEAKARLQAELDTVRKLDAEIKATVSDARQTVTSLPDEGKEALVELTAAFSGAASPDAG